MPAKSFPVTRYSLQAGYMSTATFGGVTIQAQGVLACIGASRESFTVYGLHPESAVPASPFCNLETSQGAIFVPFADLPVYVDVVRNESPVYAYLNSDRPEWMSLRTGYFEPVGEGE